jgi:hypothetical protein
LINFKTRLSPDLIQSKLATKVFHMYDRWTD